MDLSFNNLPWEEFESFVQRLAELSLLRGGIEVFNKYGKAGGKQKGIDIIGEVKEAGGRVVVAIQCRRVKKYSKAKAQATVNSKDLKKADRYILATTTQLGADVFDIFKQAGWEVWQPTDLKNRIHEISDSHQKAALVAEYFGPEAVSKLGLPWRFSLQTHSVWARGAERGGTFVGPVLERGNELSAAFKFIRSKQSRVLIVDGPGRTRFLHELGRLFEGRVNRSAKQEKWSLRYLPFGAPTSIDPSYLEARTRLVVVVDQAAERMALIPSLVEAVLLASSGSKIIVAAGGASLPLRQTLAKTKLRPIEISKLALPELSRETLKAIVATIYPEARPAFVKMLVDQTGGHLALLAMAAQAVREAKGEPFRNVADLKTLQHALLAQLPSVESDEFAVLKVLALLGPRVNQKQFAQTAAELIGLEEPRVRSLMVKLCDDGVLVEHGYAILFKQPVLASFVLRQFAEGQTPGFQLRESIEQLLEKQEFWQIPQNLAALDLRLKDSAYGQTHSLATPVWNALADHIAGLPAPARMDWFSRIKDSAWQAPRRLFWLVKKEFAREDTAIPTVLLEILAAVAESEAALRPDACELLWQQLQTGREEAFKVLRGMVEYKSWRDATFVEHMVTWLSAKLKEQPDPAHFQLFNGLHKPVVEKFVDDGQVVRWVTTHIDEANTRPARERLREFLRDSFSGFPRACQIAVFNLLAGFVKSERMAAYQLTLKNRVAWQAESGNSRQLLTELAQQVEEGPTRVKAWECMHDLADDEWSPPEYDLSARDEMLRAICGIFRASVHQFSETAKFFQAQQEEHDAIVCRFVRHVGGEQLLRVLYELFEEATEAGWNPDLSSAFRTIQQQGADLAERLAENIFLKADFPQANALVSLLDPSNEPLLVKWAGRLLDSDLERFGGSFRYLLGRYGSSSPPWIELANRLADRDDLEAVKIMIAVVREWSFRRPSEPICATWIRETLQGLSLDGLGREVFEAYCESLMFLEQNAHCIGLTAEMILHPIWAVKQLPVRAQDFVESALRVDPSGTLRLMLDDLRSGRVRHYFFSKLAAYDALHRLVVDDPSFQDVCQMFLRILRDASDDERPLFGALTPMISGGYHARFLEFFKVMLSTLDRAQIEHLPHWFGLQHNELMLKHPEIPRAISSVLRRKFPDLEASVLTTFAEGFSHEGYMSISREDPFAPDTRLGKSLLRARALSAEFRAESRALAEAYDAVARSIKDTGVSLGG